VGSSGEGERGRCGKGMGGKGWEGVEEGIKRWEGEGMRAFDDYDTPLEQQCKHILRYSERNREDGMQDNMI